MYNTIGPFQAPYEYTCICVGTCIHMYRYIYINTYTTHAYTKPSAHCKPRINTRVYVYRCIYINTHTQRIQIQHYRPISSSIWIHMYMYRYIWIHMYMYRYIYTIQSAHIKPHINMYVYVQVHIYEYTHNAYMHKTIGQCQAPYKYTCIFIGADI